MFGGERVHQVVKFFRGEPLISDFLDQPLAFRCFTEIIVLTHHGAQFVNHPEFVVTTVDMMQQCGSFWVVFKVAEIR